VLLAFGAGAGLVSISGSSAGCGSHERELVGKGRTMRVADRTIKGIVASARSRFDCLANP